jgi:hypothetical protein
LYYSLSNGVILNNVSTTEYETTETNVVVENDIVTTEEKSL